MNFCPAPLHTVHTMCVSPRGSKLKSPSARVLVFKSLFKNYLRRILSPVAIDLSCSLIFILPVAKM